MKILVAFVLVLFCFNSQAQEIGEVREVELILIDIPYSGDAIQPNFTDGHTLEDYSFNHMTWLDKHVSLFDFFKTYRDSCLENVLSFRITMIYLPQEEFEHVRYEGYLSTGDTVETWVLTSILEEEVVEVKAMNYSETLRGKFILEGADFAGYEFIDENTATWTNELFPSDPDTLQLTWIDNNTFVERYDRMNDECPPVVIVHRVVSYNGEKLELQEIDVYSSDEEESTQTFYKEP